METTKYELTSDRLAVDITAPGQAYAGTRFDWSGFVTQVTLDGRHTFCVPEDYRPGQGTGGIGLCNEFGIDQPIGFDSAKPGDPFPKLGVGLLTRLDKPDYSFWYPHQIARNFPIAVHCEADSTTFTVEPVDCRGYAARLVKVLSVVDNALEIAYHLENTGELPIRTNEYVHNFVGINQHTFGPDYQLTFPYKPVIESPSEMNEILEVSGNTIRQREAPVAPFYARLLGFQPTDQPQWELAHLPSGVRMRETVDFSPVRVAMWGVNHVISVEVFIDIHLQPGESKRWRRRFEFLD